MRRIAAMLTAVLLALTLIGPADAAGPERRRDVPSRDQWLIDVKTAMSGARAYVRERADTAASGEQLAVNFDIDNTVVATYYDGGGAIPQMAKLVKLLQRKQVAVLFNTGRSTDLRGSTRRQLESNGFPVDGLCLRKSGETLVSGKQRCRDRFAAKGYTLIANVGNNETDFEGDGYERAYVLPNYDGALG